MTRADLINCSTADILTGDNAGLVDLKQVAIDTSRPVPERTVHYLDRIGNPYLFRVDTLIVKVTFTGNRDLPSLLAGLLDNAQNTGGTHNDRCKQY